MTTEADIAAYLASKGRGTVGTTIFTNTLPSSPDAVIAIFAYAGQAPERMSCGVLDKPSFQVRVRGAKNGAGAARALIETIFKDLDGLSNITLSGTAYQSITSPQSGPAPMGEDENGRTEYVWNFYTSKSR
jgi:hypothetical protein